ncbi:transcription factor DIVARICATA-like [Gastrolobium bilobum]|uniref:transcription factor DIVARICATA-like n=1 Tax=Gastrolobium bilobum TaxID=150636 RepID=UPI002AAF26C4|nr:transcription factor DIVARICATA-like [Gastrolobium bilobum]
MSQLPQQENNGQPLDACAGGSYINADGVLTHWTREQDTAFEDALVIFPEDLPEPERWEKLAALVPGKSPAEVREHYRVLVHDLMEIEAGRVPLPLYSDDLSPVQVKNNSGTHRKKGVAWTEEEHKLFLYGLQTFGRGDWRSIARYVVKTRNPTQVASHAQKYFLRLAQGATKKERKRTSIHDITLNAENNNIPLPIHQQNWLPPPPVVTIQQQVQERLSVHKLLEANVTQQALELQKAQDMKQRHPPNNMPHQMGGYDHVNKSS